MDALELWAGEGAVLSYGTDRARWAVLMERCEPDTSLLRAELDVDSALDSAASLARHLTTWNPWWYQVAISRRSARPAAKSTVPVIAMSTAT